MMDKRLLLINPPFPRKVASVPLQMLYLAAAVKDTGLDVQLLDLDYANQRYSLELAWLNFDEGWGAFHPNTTVEQAQRYLTELDRRRTLKPQIWDPNIPGAIRRF